MHELVSERAFSMALAYLAVGGPVVGLMSGLVVSRIRRTGSAAIVKGTLLGGGCTLVWALWRLYAALTGALGPSSTRNLLVQIGLFAVVGVVGGILYTRFRVKHRQT